MNLQQNSISLKKKLTQQGKLFEELCSCSHELVSGQVDLSEKEPFSNADLQNLVTLKTEQLALVAEDLQKTQIALVHAQKMESLGELAAGMAHEINTPLQYIGGNLEFMQQAFDQLTKCVATTMNLLEQAQIDDESLNQDKRKVDFVLSRLPTAISQSREGVDNLSRIVRAMRRFSHITEEPVETNLNDCIDSTLTVSKAEWKYVANVNFEPDENLPNLICLPGDLNQALLNMIVNAAHAIEEKLGDHPEEKGEISIRTFFDDEDIAVEIQDTGMGIPREAQEKIFDQFFTTKEVGKGTGQGLAICRSIIVEKHGGRVAVTTAPSEGTTFTIYLPRDWKLKAR